MRKRQTQNTEFVNLANLRKLYGRSSTGKSRISTTITMTSVTRDMIDSIVHMGPGSYASPFIELACRVLSCSIFDADTTEMIGNEILTCIRSPYMAGNLRALANYIEGHSNEQNKNRRISR